jgi:hypothetical protein
LKKEKNEKYFNFIRSSIPGKFWDTKITGGVRKVCTAEKLIDNGLYLEASQLLHELCIEDDKNFEILRN